MNREYHEWESKALGRPMELLVFGHAGLPVVAFPTSCGRFFDFEDRGMVAAIAGRIEAGGLQLFCVDTADRESWYNQRVPPRRRIARHNQYESYILQEVVPFIQQKNSRQKNPDPRLVAVGCSFGGYHAVNLALRHPDVFGGFVSLSGVFDLQEFLDGYYDEDCYFHLPTHYLPRLDDPRYLDRFRGGNYALVTGCDDPCLEQNQQLHRILSGKGIPHRFSVWEGENTHDWPTWQRMMQEYLGGRD
jgi:esterase/lipase superfamily enzyme